MRYPLLREAETAIWSAFELLSGCFERGGKLLIAGNGGSCADSDHIVGELMKGFLHNRPLDESRQHQAAQALVHYAPDAAAKLQGALPAISLTQNTALMTAFANDVDAELGIAQQVVGYGLPGDVFWGLSTSGNARNLNIAMRIAKAWGLKTLGLTGAQGGSLREACDVCICVPAECTPQVQELHLPVYHCLCRMLEIRFFGC